MSSNFLNLAIAKALGLKTENLVEFDLEVRADKLPQVRATYLVRDADALVRVMQLYEIRPQGQIGFCRAKD